MLIKTEPGFDVLQVSWKVILLFVILTVGFFTLAIGLGIKAQRRKPTTGQEGLINEIGEAITDLNPDGSIKIHGEIWNAESIEGFVSKGSKIIVTGISNLKLLIKEKNI
jgi:membrane-bound serine protease (ClpP class)